VSESVSLKPWIKGEPAPEMMTLCMDMHTGAVAADGNTAYFSKGYNVYSYTVHENMWTRLQPCRYQYPGLAVINNKLTTIGGRDRNFTTNSLLSLSGGLMGKKWKEIFPPMPTNRILPAAATTPTYLVVAGGQGKPYGSYLATVEVLDIKTLQWATACNLPEAVGTPPITVCDGDIYLSRRSDGTMFFCSIEDLLKSCNPTFWSTNSSNGSVWTNQLAENPAKYFSLISLKKHVLAIGGASNIDGDTPSRAIHCYDVATNSWSEIGRATRLNSSHPSRSRMPSSA